MALKTFNVDEKSYKQFSDFCKENGISMSRQIELFIRFFNANEKDAKELLEKIKRLKGL